MVEHIPKLQNSQLLLVLMESMVFIVHLSTDIPRNVQYSMLPYKEKWFARIVCNIGPQDLHLYSGSCMPAVIQIDLRPMNFQG